MTEDLETEQKLEKVAAGSGEVPRFEIKSKFRVCACEGSTMRDIASAFMSIFMYWGSCALAWESV